MPSASEISEQISHESDRRSRLSVPAFGGGALYLLSGIVVAETLKGAPKVGLLQGIEPALSGVANPTVSPRAAEVKFISHHAVPLTAGSVVAAVAVGVLTLVLLLLVDATRFRRPESWSMTRPLVLFGGVAVVVVSIGHQVLSAILTHRFSVGHDFSDHAVELALTKGTANTISNYLDLLAVLALAAGMIAAMVGAMRVGLLTRWMGVLGIFTGVLIFLPIGGDTLEIVPAFWITAMGMLYAERWPGGDPPAWTSGEARPWPTRADQRAAAQAGEGEVLAGAGSDFSAVPALPGANGSPGKRKRRRGARSGEGQRPE
jgi:NADH:ubiquinone oxidoreductase subunit 6 (subunit J)